MLLAVGLAALLLLSVVSSALIANRRIIGIPLERLLRAIKQNRSGGQRTLVDGQSRDEIGDVLTAFNEMLTRQHAYEEELHDARDALEAQVDERTRDLALATEQALRAQRQLSEAIENVPDGLSLSDADDRLVIFNSRRRDMFFGAAPDVIQIGLTFEQILRSCVERGLIREAEDDPEAWIKQRLRLHRTPGEPQVQRLDDDTWVRISEPGTEDGGTVAIYSDIRRAGSHLLEVINEILDLSKIEAGRLDLNPEDIDLAPLLDDLVATVGPLAEKNQNRLQVRRRSDLGHVRTDPTRLRQILLNLLSNACKFTEHGEVVLEVARAAPATERTG